MQHHVQDLGGPVSGFKDPLHHWPQSEPLAEHSVSDAELLRRCRRSDAEAWDVLVRRYDGMVFGVAMQCQVTREEAADITQTTFIALLDSIDTLREGERLPGWLSTVARRSAWRVQRRMLREGGLPSQVVSDIGEPIADPIADWEQAAWLHEALQQLPRPCRDVLIALYFDPTNPSYRAVADRTGRAIGTIGPMRARCLARLRTLMRDGEET